MTTALQWRQPQLSDTVHLAEAGAHRALCGADVLHAFTDAEVPRYMACATCTANAGRQGLQCPPFTRPRSVDTQTRRLF